MKNNFNNDNHLEYNPRKVSSSNNVQESKKKQELDSGDISYENIEFSYNHRNYSINLEDKISVDHNTDILNEKQKLTKTINKNDYEYQDDLLANQVEVETQKKAVKNQHSANDIPTSKKKEVKNKQGKRNNKKDVKRELISVLVVFVVIYILFRYIFISFSVDGNSMEPTFVDGEKGIMVRENIINEPHQFDVVALKGQRNYGENIVVIKRIIGMPGDKVVIKNNDILINNVKISDEFSSENTKMDDMISLRVPFDHYFVLGDNRNNSKDSRSVGFINKDDIIAVGGFIYWPLDRFKIFN